MSIAKAFIDRFRDTQTLPHVVTKLSKLIADSNTTMKEFEDVISMDPILVSRLLKLVNSPFYGLRQEVDSISRAVAFIGMKNLHNIAVTDAMRTIFSKQEDSTAFSRNQLWLHCAAVSICSKMVAERILGINGDDAYLCGILHDFGLIVEEQVDNKHFLEICGQCKTIADLVELEQKMLDTNHCEIGCLITADWSMPESIQEAIRDHHTMLDIVEPTSLTGLIQISEYLTGQIGHTTLPDITVQISPPLLEHIQENMDEYTVLMEDFPDEMSKAQDVFGSDGDG